MGVVEGSRYPRQRNLKRLPHWSLGSREVAVGAGGVWTGMGVVCERHVDWGNGGVVVMKGEWNGLGHGRPGNKSTPPWHA